MKESMAKTKLCPHFSMVAATQNMSSMLMHVIAATSGNSSTMERAVIQAGNLINGNNDRYFCLGSNCVMWEPEYKEELKELKPTDDSPGDEWIKKQRIAGQPNIVWARWVPIDVGDCGLKSKEQGCFASCQ